MNNKETLIKNIDVQLGKNKNKFLSDLRENIYDYVSNRTCKECLSITEKEICWEPSDSLDGYIPRFIAFLRKKKYNGNELDSALTEKIVSITTSTYNKYIQDNSSTIIKPILQEMLDNKIIIESLAKQIVDKWEGTISYALRQQLVGILIHKIEDSIGDNIVTASSNAVTTICTKVVASAVSIPISKSIAILLAKNMTIALKGVIAKVLASTAIKTMIATMAKKMIAAKIIAIIISLIGAKLAGISIGWILAPLIIAFIIYEFNTLPTKMADKISNEVANELSGNFSDLNHKVSSSIVLELSKSAFNTFLSDVINDVSMRDIIDQIQDEL